MRVLLTTLNAKYIHINLAIRLLYELNREFPGLEQREFTIKEKPDDIARACAGFDVVAFSCYIWNITQTLAVARYIKALYPDTKILLGGPEVSYDWQSLIALPEVDFIITGEGEMPFKAFLYAFPETSHLHNLVWKKDGEVHYSPDPTIFDLKQLEDIQPYRHDDPATLPHRVAYIETSRGCPYKCEFCLASLDNKVRYLPDTHIKAGLLYLMTHGKVIKFLDRTFNVKREFTLDIFRFILANYRPGNVFQFEITADILHPEIVAFIRENVPDGLFRFEIGIQTLNQKANLAVSRKQHFEKTKAVIEALQDKVEMHLDLIVGLAHDYWEDVRYSFEQVFLLFPPELQLGFLKFLKGTPVRDKHEQHGFVFDPNPPYEIIESNYLSRQELDRIRALEHALEIYWNKKRMPRTLRYVALHHGIFDFLLGLGELFVERHPGPRHTLMDVFETAKEYMNTHYPDDGVMRELLELDYCLYHKIRPRPLVLNEPPRAQKEAWLQGNGFNTRAFRHLVFDVHFDLPAFENQGVVVPATRLLTIEYSGESRPSYH